MTKEVEATEQTAEDLVRELQEIDNELARMEAFHRENKIVTFKDLANQAAFTKSRAQTRLLFGSNRSGKSVRGTVEEIACAHGYRPWLPVDHPDRIVRLANGKPIPVPNIGFHLLENLKVSGTQVFLPKMIEWLPKGAATIKKNNLGQPVSINYKNGSVLHVVSQEQSTASLEGANGHYVVSDEPPARDKWIALTRGLIDNSGISWIQATPIKASHFMAELMTEASKPDSDVDLISISIDDNRISKGGYLEDAAVDRFIASLRPDEIPSRVYGKPAHLAGAVFNTWEPRPPMLVDPYEIPAHWPRIMGVDPAGNKPMAALWAAISPQNQWIFYRDLYNPMLQRVSDVAEVIKRSEGWDQFEDGTWFAGLESEPVVIRLIDTSSNVHEYTSGMDVRSTFAMQGNDLTFMNAPKTGYLASIDMIREMIRMDNKTFEWDSGPQLVIFNTCTRLIHEMQNFVWHPESSQGRRTGADPIEKPLKTCDDCIDIMRYMMLLRATYSGLVRIMRSVQGEKW